MMPAAKMKYVPHKVLREGSTFVAVADGNYVLEVRTVVSKVSRILGPDDKPLTGPDGNPIYNAQTNAVVSLLTKEEWKVRKETEDSGIRL